MSRYIDADKLAREFERHPDRWYFGRDVLREIGEAETEDAEPVVHGEWDYDDLDDISTCSVCGKEWILNEKTPRENSFNYCPHCGARMVTDDGA